MTDTLPVAAWMNSRGLDAETLANVVQLMPNKLWFSSAAYKTMSSTMFYEFLYEVTLAFQARYYDIDWLEDGDYWGCIEQFCNCVTTLLKTQAISFQDDAAAILQKVPTKGTKHA